LEVEKRKQNEEKISEQLKNIENKILNIFKIKLKQIISITDMVYTLLKQALKMKQTLSIRQKTFKFINEFDSNDESYYLITIIVKELFYDDGKIFYDIGYKYEFNGLEKNKKIIHPYYHTKDVVDFDLEGVIVCKNKMTETMVAYLLLDLEELENESGSSTAQTYRTNIMIGLARLWD